MGSSSQRLETVIAINATVGNGFSEAGNTLTQMGALVDGISQQLIDFGRESIQVYRDYEKSMADAEVALSTQYGQNSKELKEVMANLDVSATEWAASTIFHTNDVANAISEAAHAGWDYDKIINGLPAAMELAEAGSLDLSDAVNYIVKATTAAGVTFDKTGEFIDLWAYAANKSASTIDEFGEAMLRMGNTMRFAADPEELMTLIAVTANAGSVGSEAGTLIRNSVLRLVAPTQKASEVMEELGATSEETAGLMEDQALQAANARLAAEGFSAYDENGKLKNVLDTYRDLYVALQNIAGEYGDIATNQETLEILSAIFPTRTITEALTLLRSAKDGYNNLYEDMKNGAAEGYGEYAAERMMDTLNGRIETFESKLERLKQITGEALSDDLSDFLAGAGDIIDDIAGLDEGKFNALIAGGKTLAAAGPGLLTAGSALRLIGTIVNSKAALGGTLFIAATTFLSAMKELSESNFESNFGTADLDSEAITEYVDSLTSGYQKAYAEVNAFRQEIDKSINSYQEASSSLTSSLLTDMLTDATLTSSDIATLNNLGAEMQDAVLSGLQNSADAKISYWEVLFGDSANESEAFSDIYGATQYAYDEAVAEAESIGQGLREAMSSAFADGHINEEEYQNILSYVESYNEAMARAAQEASDRENEKYYQKMLHKAQTASEEEMEQLTKDIRDKTESILSDEKDQYEDERASLVVDYNKAIEDGIEFRGGAATEERLSELLAELDAKFEARYLSISEQRDETILDMWQSQVKQSDLGDAYNDTMQFVKEVLNGNMEADAAVSALAEKYGANPNAGEVDYGAMVGNPSERNQLSEVFARMIDGIGGYDQLVSKIADYEEKGDFENANNLREIYAGQMLVDNFAETGIEENSDLLKWIFGDDAITSTAKGVGRSKQAGREKFEESVGIDESDYSPEEIRNTIDMLGSGERSIPEFFKELRKAADGTVMLDDIQADYWKMSDSNREQLNQFVSQLKEQYDFEQIQKDAEEDTITAQQGTGLADYYATDQILYGDIDPEQYKIQVTPEIDESTMQDLGPYPVAIQPHVEGEDGVSELQNQGVDVQVDGDTAQLQASIDGEDGQELMAYVSGDATDLSMSISDQDGKTLVEKVTGDASGLASVINRYNGQTITVNIQGRKMFAAGGRATEASIFGEAGPEWAIPEEHSARTADLLNAAREASGFTWPDLLERYGGLNANASNTPSTIVYSPTINAANAEGVEKVLLDDKERLDKWYRKKQKRDELEVYA